jgi:NTP pyrophosphatase (non-canonical NTP hydrolase)
MNRSNNHVRITLLLTREEWCEVANAISSKAVQVERGDYGSALEEEGDDVKWVATLNSAYAKIAKELDKKGVTY